MITVDRRVGSKELKPFINLYGVPCRDESIEFADVAFEGRGEGDSTIAIGIERKTVHDMLHCINDSRYNNQRIGMRQAYAMSYLIIEGMWKPHDESGLLMESQDGVRWYYSKPRGNTIMYNTLYRFLLSVSLSKVQVIYSRNLKHTAFNCCEVYQYFQKRWKDHTSMLGIHELNIPAMTEKPSLVRKWAADIEGIGVKLSEEAEKYFRKPIKLATSDEQDWMRACSRMGPSTAQDIIKQIHGIPRK